MATNTGMILMKMFDLLIPKFLTLYVNSMNENVEAKMASLTIAPNAIGLNVTWVKSLNSNPNQKGRKSMAPIRF